MASPYTVTYEETPDPADEQAVRDGLSRYNLAHTDNADDTFQRLDYFVRDADGTVIGGLIGGTYWGWLHVDILWLSEGLRHQGYGSRLLAAAEEEAVRRGCRHAHLDTMDFQALPFYQRHGYTIFGALHDLPPGHTRFFLQKHLPPPSVDDQYYLVTTGRNTQGVT